MDQQNNKKRFYSSKKNSIKSIHNIPTPIYTENMNVFDTDLIPELRIDNELLYTIQKQLQELQFFENKQDIQIHNPKYNINTIVKILVQYCCPSIDERWNYIESKDLYKIIDIFYNNELNDYMYVLIEMNRDIEDYLLNGLNSKTIIIKQEEYIKIVPQVIFDNPKQSKKITDFWSK